jgi:DNA-binding NtrC family response regulator
MRILIVDDITGYLEIVEMYLPPDAQVCKASNLSDAKHLTDAEPLDLAIVDVRLNEADGSNREGLEFLEWAQGHHPDLPVVMVSAYRGFEFETEAYALGAHDFIHKPVDPDRLAEAVAAARGTVPK